MSIKSTPHYLPPTILGTSRPTPQHFSTQLHIPCTINSSNVRLTFGSSIRIRAAILSKNETSSATISCH